MKTFIFSVALMLVALGANALPGSITNTLVVQRTGAEERVVDIQFNLTGSAAEYDISLEVSFDNGTNYVPVDPNEITGSLTVAPGAGIQLVWDGSLTYGTVYAEMTRIRITATPVGCTFTDIRDDNTYRCVTIGDQVWMAENLKYLPWVDDPGTGSVTAPHYYVYDYVGTDLATAKATANYQNYGVLYNWPAAITGNVPGKNGIVQDVCPTGWHLPSDAEWTQLTVYLGGESVAGGKLKSTRTDPDDDHPRWDDPNTDATDYYGFSALPGGGRFPGGGNYFYIGEFGFWWTANENSPTSAYVRTMNLTGSNVSSGYDDKIHGLSVRCVRDIE